MNCDTLNYISIIARFILAMTILDKWSTGAREFSNRPRLIADMSDVYKET